MANKKINQLVSKTTILSTDLFGIGDATTGQLFKKTIAELQAAIGGAVISVNGLVGTVVLDTDDIQELATPTNKYFTDARARGAISLTVTGNSGASTYSSGTGVLNVPTYTLAGLGGITASFLSGTSGISYNSTTGVISYSGTVYTDASIRALLSGSTGISYNSSTGAISYSGTVYTDASVRALISITTTGTSGASTYNNTTGVINVPNYTLAGLGGISYTSLSGGTGITYNNTTGAISYSGTVYTDASVRALISATGNISYNSTTGVISTSLTQYTDALARASVSLTTTGTSGASTYNSTTGVFNIPNYGSALSGYLPLTGGTLTGALGGTSASFSINQNADTIVSVSNTTAGTTSQAYFQATSDTTAGYTSFGKASSSITAYKILTASSGYIYNSKGDISILNDASTGTIKMAAGGSSTAHLTITSAGNVGIGVTSVGYPLQVNKTGADSGIYGYNIAQFGDATTNAQGLRIATSTGTSGLTNLIAATNNDASQFAFWTWTGSAWGERMRITSAGNVGINGTPTDYGSGSKTLSIVHTGTSGNPFFDLYYNGDRKGYLAAAAADFYIATPNPDIGIIFETAGNARMKVHGYGNVSIGTTTDNGYKLYVSGTIYATGNITANSDLTLKKNLELITNPTDKLMQLNGYAYQWKSNDEHQYGVIAQEVEKILPYAVSTGNDGIKGVSYNQIIPVLIEAVKEQKKELEELKNILASK